MPSRIRLDPNKPLTLKLLDPFADSSERYDSEMGICEYRTIDGRILALPRAAAIQLNELSPAPGEEIGVCRYTGNQSRIAVWLTASTEQARATQEDASELTKQLAASIQQARNGKPTKEAVTPIRRKPANRQDDQPRLFDRGTGTDGPVALPALPLPAAAKERVKYGVMLAHIVRTVKYVLETEKLQLGDDPTEKIIVTLFIDACKQVRPVYDFTEGR